MTDRSRPRPQESTTSPGDVPLERTLSRRTLLKGLGLSAAGLSAAGVLEACSPAASSAPSAGASSAPSVAPSVAASVAASAGKIVIGFVTPQTGQLAGFASGDEFVVDRIRAADAYAKGFQVGGKTYDVEIVVKDTQSDPNRASQVAQELILQDGADMIVTTSTPETTNPVAQICEAQGVPCLSTVVPWEAWFFGRQPA